MADKYLLTFDRATIDAIRELLALHHHRLGQHNRPAPERTGTARNYDSAIFLLGEYMAQVGEALPTKSLLENWRDDMVNGRVKNQRRGTYSASSVNLKLAAARKLLRAVADDVVNIEIKMALRDWASVKDAKSVHKQDKIERDYGLRLTLEELADLLRTIPLNHIRGIRDRALIAVMAGAGLRVSEVVALSMRDVFLTWNARGQRGLYVVKGKHGRSRVVVLNSQQSWVIRAVRAYTDLLKLDENKGPEVFIFRGVKRLPGRDYETTAKRLSVRSAQRAVTSYPAMHEGQPVRLNAHDLRRTYAKLCRDWGMSWEAIREQLGHRSVTTTERYVGKEVDWTERQPGWEIIL